MATEARYTWTPDVPIAPGETIRELLEERTISQVDFAMRLGRSEKFVSQLVNGKAPLSYETAIELERVLGAPAAYWNSAEATYRGLLARQQLDIESEEQTSWAKSFPLKDMASHGWIARESGVAAQHDELLRFFGVSSIGAYEQYWGSERRLAARMSTAYTAATPAIAAWLRAGERAAEEIRTERFDETTFRDVLVRLRAATRLSCAQWQREIAVLGASAGVAIVFVPDLPKTRCPAVSWWSNRSRAVVQLGLRYRTDDQVWFSLYHEAGHLLLDERSTSRISDLDGDKVAEDRANRFAADSLIPPADYTEFISGGRPSKAQVRSFAARIGIAPSIVVGRLQKDSVIPHDWMNDLKTKLTWAG
jgi:HTH-type transcriptional regulator/antitoxin HigA